MIIPHMAHRHARTFLLACAALLPACVFTPHLPPNPYTSTHDATTLPEPAIRNPDLALNLALPSEGGMDPPTVVVQPGFTLPLVYTNTSPHRLNVIRDRSSFGDEALSLDFRDSHTGQTYHMQRFQGFWSNNMIHFWSLKPGEHAVLEIPLDTWRGLPPLTHILTGTLTAHLTFHQSTDYLGTTLWTGTVDSPPTPCRLEDRRTPPPDPTSPGAPR